MSAGTTPEAGERSRVEMNEEGRASPETRDFGPEVVLDRPAWIHPTVQLHGRIRIGEGASLWPNAVIRAECHEVVVGAYANVQDFAMIHVGYETDTRIGAYTSLAHHCVVHGAVIGESCMIGIRAVVMDGCEVGDNSIVGAGALLTDGTVVPPGSVVVGAPGKVRRRRNSFVDNRLNAMLYHRNGLAYAAGRHRAWHGPEYEAWAAAERERIEREFAGRYPAEAAC